MHTLLHPSPACFPSLECLSPSDSQPTQGSLVIALASSNDVLAYLLGQKKPQKTKKHVCWKIHLIYHF